jgi:hypothetical protein
MSIKEKIESAIRSTLETLKADPSAAVPVAEGLTFDDFKTKQVAKAAALGGGAAAIPILGYATIPAEIAAFIRLMSVSAMGPGVIRYGQASEEDFFNILSHWAGGVELNDGLRKAIVGQLAAHGAVMASHVAGPVAAKVAVKLMAHAFSMAAGVLVAKKMAPKILVPVTGAIAGQIAPKLGTRWIPFVSAGVGATINGAIINSLIDAADRYYAFLGTIPTPAAPQAALSHSHSISGGVITIKSGTP